MACMGPSYDFAKEQGEEAFKEIMTLLEEKYQIKNWPGNVVPQGDNMMYTIWARQSGEWDEKAEELKKAVIEIIWHQHCMDF